MNLRVIRSSSRCAELADVDRDAALRAAVRNVDDGRLPGHQRRQAADFVEIDFGVIAQAALHRPAGAVVLHAVADERAQLAVVHLDGDLHLHFAAGRDEERAQAVGQLELVGGPVEISWTASKERICVERGGASGRGRSEDRVASWGWIRLYYYFSPRIVGWADVRTSRMAKCYPLDPCHTATLHWRLYE